MKKCALLTCDDLSGFVTDESFLEKALQKAGWSFDWISWKQKDVQWDEYDVAIVRTTWDYSQNQDEFLRNLKVIDQSKCLLLNSFDLIKWNIDKIYLKELNDAGLAIVPTLWLKPMEINEIFQSFELLKTSKIVIKPRVGAGAKNTYLLCKDDFFQYENQFKSLINCNIMVQPFMEKVSFIGEYSVHYFAGNFSHAILKKPKAGDFRSQEEFGSEIVLVALSEKQKIFCESVLKKIKEPFLYARVDFIYSDLLEENLIELELIEPSLYFRYKEGSAELLVEKLNLFI